MSVDTAFLPGVLIDQSIVIPAVWSALLKLVRIFLSANLNGDKQSPPDDGILFLLAMNIPNTEEEWPMMPTTDMSIYLSRPETLELSREYMLRIRHHSWRKYGYVAVKFVGFTPCPGVVIVCDGNQHNQRVLRSDIFRDGTLQSST